jgi:DNA repair exonuclease SbcCD ATPase subunit
MSITLYLENFRCWKKKTFTFNKNGIILLSGISGKGKSTILNAIVFAVTGNMKNVTPMGREKEHLKVELSIDDVVISRCKNPTRFTVKKLNDETGKIKVYEEDEAQSIIDDLLGTDFKHCSYIDQDNTFSFVYLSPEAKMTFLRNLLLSNEPVTEYRDNIKTLLDKTKTEILKEDATINISSGFLKKMTFIENNLESTKDSTKESTKKNKLKDVTLDTFAKVMESFQRNLEISQKNHKILSTKKSKAESDYKRSIENQSNRQKRTELKEELQQICGDLTPEMMHEKLADFKRRQERYKKYKQYKKEKDEYISIKTKVDELTFQLESLSIHQENFGDIKTVQKLISMEEKLIEMQDKITEEQEQILEKMVNELKKEKVDIEKKIEQSHLYNCPSCNEYLNMVNGELVLYKEKVEEKCDDISSLTYALSILEKNLKNVQKQLDVLLHQRSEYNKLFDDFELLAVTIEKKYNNNDYSALLSSLKKDEQTFLFTKKNKEDTERQLKRFNLYEDTEEDTEEVTEEVIENIVREILKIEQQLSRHTEISSRLKKLDEVDTSDTSDNVDYSSLLSDYKEKLLQTDEKISQYSDSIRQLEIWRQNEENNIKYKELEESIQRSKDAKDYGMEVVKCCEKLLLYVKDAETRSVFDFIESLNYHASLYIEDFFPDEDFHVQLSTTKELKSGKDKMGLFFEVQYGTMKGELDFLSGGQRDRVNLAFTLAFSELVQNRVLLLDECISSLDSETSDTVIETLHQKYKGKLIICVAHQVNTGIFDQVVEI